MIEREATPREIEECLAKRQAEWDELRKSGDTDALAWFESMFVKDGQLIKLRFIGTGGVRREPVMYEALELQRLFDLVVEDIAVRDKRIEEAKQRREEALRKLKIFPAKLSRRERRAKR